MSQYASRFSTLRGVDEKASVQVQAPSASAGIAKALRASYVAPRMPEDFTQLLARIR